MLDITLRGIDQQLADRIKAHARDKDLTLNEAIIQLLRQATGLEATTQSMREIGQDIASLTGTFSGDETRAFREALTALESVHPDDLLRRSSTGK